MAADKPGERKPSYRLKSFERLDSTSTYALAHLDELADGDVIEAGIQTAGRGRMNRPWISQGPGNLCLSLVLKPRHHPPSELPLANLSQLLAVEICRVLDNYGVSASIKWPNDVLVSGRKIAGILAESKTQGDAFLGMVLGVGLNLNLDTHTLAAIDQPATSLNLLLNRPIDKIRVRQGLLDCFFSDYAVFLERGFALIHDEFRGRCLFLGQAVEIRWPGRIIRGKAEIIDGQGELIVTDADQQQHRLNLGELIG